MITISEPPKPMEATMQDRRPLPLGILDRLPVELLHWVLSELDFRSMTRFSRVSIRARNVLRSLPAYRDLMNHAPQTLAALGQTKLIHHHSASDLLAALRTECCATCLEYGAYLFLPTCERCCWQCLRSNITRRVITPTAAGRIFALSPGMVRQLPAMFSIPGTYDVTRTPARILHKLVSVSAAKKYAMSIYGSVANLEKAIARRTYGGPTAYTTRYLEAAFLDSTDSDPVMMPDQGAIAVDPYFGMASIPFPSLPTPGVVNTGLWCKGCEWTCERQKNRQLPAHVIANTVPAGYDPNLVLLGLARRAYSRIGLLGHIRSCHGAQQLLADEGVEEH